MIRFSKRFPRRGFSLLETLMVVSLIGTLVALLLPAVQAAREQARANACRHQLAQLWLATQMYHSSFQCFPAGTLGEPTPIRQFPAGYHHGWMVQIRPRLDGGTAFADALDARQSVYAPVNWPLRQSFAMDLFACPSSPYAFDTWDPSYVAIHDGRPAGIEAASRGAFVANRFLQREDFPDGLSTTLFLGEQRGLANGDEGLGWMSGTQTTLRTTGVPLQLRNAGQGGPLRPGLPFPYAAFSPDGASSYEAFVRQVAQDPELDLEQLSQDDWEALEQQAQTMPLSGEAAGEAEQGGMGGANANAPFFSSTYPLMPFGPRGLEPQGLGSFHAATVHGVTGDGKVVALASTIDAALLRGLGIRDDATPLLLPEAMDY